MSPKPPVRRPVAAFISHISDEAPHLTGINGRGEPQRYIPLTVLRKYWTRPKILDLLQIHDLDLEVDYVLEHLQLFSAWVYINEVELYTMCVNFRIQHFFPLASQASPPRQLAGPGYMAAIDQLRESQWMFFPCSLEGQNLPNVHIEPEHIWPFDKKNLISSKGDATKVFRVELDASCGMADKSYHPHRKSTSNILILKSYTESSYYDNERRLFLALREQNKDNQNIIGYLGSFQQNGTYNLLLEYANAGNLNEFLLGNEPPQDQGSIRQFWSSLSNILRGLYGVHQIMIGKDNDASSGHSYQGVHEDIKPDNILLSKEEPSSTVYDFIPKLADFGLSDTRPVPADGTTLANRDWHGNQLYCAPEASHHRRHHKTGKWLSHKVDLFSLGCVFSECAVYIAFGKKGVHEYLQLRKEALIASGPDIRGLQGCFHDGVNRLGAVDEMHRQVVAYCRASGDDITPGIIDLIEKYMLVSEERRHPANVLYEEFQHLLCAPGKMPHHLFSIVTQAVQDISLRTEGQQVAHQTPNGHVPGRPVSGGSFSSLAGPTLGSPLSPGPPELSSTPTTPIRPGNPQVSPLVTDNGFLSSPDIFGLMASPLSFEPLSPITNITSNTSQFPLSRTSPTPSRPPSPYVTTKISVDQAKHWREAVKNNRIVDRDVDREMEDLRRKLKGRNYIFYLDDSRTMEYHRSETIELFETLGYIAKGLDADGSIELMFASDSSNNTRSSPRDSKNVTPLLNDLTNCRYQHDVSFTEKSIQALVNTIIHRLPLTSSTSRRFSFSKKRQPISVFIFTDGRWEDWQYSDRQHAIETAISRLMKEMNQRNLDRTHLMIQFIRFGHDVHGIRRLRSLDNLGKADEFKCDIVDSKPSDGCVKSMFIGSITPENDDASDGDDKA